MIHDGLSKHSSLDLRLFLCLFIEYTHFIATITVVDSIIYKKNHRSYFGFDLIFIASALKKQNKNSVCLFVSLRKQHFYMQYGSITLKLITTTNNIETIQC